MKNQKVKLHSTYQPHTYYASASKLPDHALETLLASDLEFFKESLCGGGGVKLRASDVNIDGEKYDLEYTVYYSQDFYNDFPDLVDSENGEIDQEKLESECLAIANEFLAYGLQDNVYLYHV